MHVETESVDILWYTILSYCFTLNVVTQISYYYLTDRALVLNFKQVLRILTSVGIRL